MVFPGAQLDGASLFELFEQESVTATAGVPTVWMALINHMQQNQLKFSTLERAVVGGSAVPPAMIRTFAEVRRPDRGPGAPAVPRGTRLPSDA